MGAVDAVESLEIEPLTAVRSFETFYAAEYRSVVGLAYALTGSRSASEELAQDAFSTAFRQWGKIGGYEKPEAWIRRVLVNASRSRGRRLGAELRAITRLSGRRERLMELPEPDHEFWAAVRALPTRQCQAVTLHYLEDHAVDQIAEILDCTSGTVKQHLFRARQALAQSLGVTAAQDPDQSEELLSGEEGQS